MRQTISNMSISLPSALKKYVHTRTEEDHYSTPSDYIRSLIRQDVKLQQELLLEKKLLEGMASGPTKNMSKRDWKKIKILALSKTKKYA